MAMTIGNMNVMGRENPFEYSIHEFPKLTNPSAESAIEPMRAFEGTRLSELTISRIAKQYASDANQREGFKEIAHFWMNGLYFEIHAAVPAARSILRLRIHGTISSP